MVSFSNQISSINPLIAANPYNQILPAASNDASAKIKDEFLTIFYKELLKQAFKAPDLSLGDREEENNFFSSFNSDLMVEQLAQELAKSAAFRPEWVKVNE